jgi:arylsulfatase A-like enzyme
MLVGMPSLAISIACGWIALGSWAAAPGDRPPSVVLVITDDQGHGDLGFHGNPRIRTPHLDLLASRSLRFTRFYVSPVCSPTRASLLTGRYNYRTGVCDTYQGRSMMHPDERTLAEMLAAAGYATGIFGKWHLGDNHPLRPRDQGFQESLVLKGGGIGQPSDLPGGSSYFDPVLLENGRPVKTRGYVSDVITDRAIRFLEANHARPFLLYLAFNAPHTPLEVPEYHRSLYRGLEDDTTARVYGMVTNIDDNVGRLLARLDGLGIADDTIVVFLTDNGPQQERYTSGLRGTKGTPYEGGIRVPCFVRWPRRFPAGVEDGRVAAHIDITPTLLAACGVARPADVRLDGIDLLAPPGAGSADRTIHIQWHRGDVPEALRAFAAVGARWKLVQPLGTGPGPMPDPIRLELYDILADPGEKEDLASRHPAIVESMRRGYEAWFGDVSATRGFEPPRILLGTPRENPVILTPQDRRGAPAGSSEGAPGHWEVETAAPGEYWITIHFRPGPAGTARFALGSARAGKAVGEGEATSTIGPLRLEAGPGRIEASIDTGGGPRDIKYLEVKRLDGATPPPPAPRPANVVLILADDLGWGDLGCYGNSRWKTPRIDALAAEGVRLTSFYAPFPFCAPTRAALLTGRHPFRSGFTRNPVPAEDPLEKNADGIGLDPREMTLADVFRKAGYRTGLAGKWHLGHRREFHPRRRGFDDYLGILCSNDMPRVELVDGDQVVEYPVVQATLQRRLTERALDFITANRERPFFLLLAPHVPHKPLAASEAFHGKSGAGLYGDAVAELDWSVGQVLERLDALGLARDTLVVFTSDNGPWYGGSTGGLRGMKGQTWEGGLRVPFIARWPGRILAGRTSAEPATMTDLFTTALAAAGIAVPADRVIDGKDILPLIAGEAPSPHEAVFAFRGERVAAVRSGRWKLHLLPPGPAAERRWRPEEPWTDPRRPDGVRILAPPEQAHPSQHPGVQGGDPVKGIALFDLEADPAEAQDVSAAHPETVERLRVLAERLREG